MAHLALHWWYPQAYQKIQVAMYHGVWGNYKHEYPFSFLQIYIYIYWSASKWTENDQSRLNRIKVHRIGLNRPEWTKLDRKKKTKKTKWTELYEREPNGPKWTKLYWIDRSGPKRTELDIKGPKWTELDRSRPKRTEMDRIRQKRTQMDNSGQN